MFLDIISIGIIYISMNACSSYSISTKSGQYSKRSSNRIIRMGTEGAYPPYNFINENNEVDGFEREFGD